MIAFKVKRTEGVGVKPGCGWIKYVGKSRLDGFPIFSTNYKGPITADIIKDRLIVNTKPGYILEDHEIERIKSLDGEMIRSFSDDLVPVKPMDSPSGTLFYIDYVYEDLDPRLLLMM
jgi:hypothetical protein